MKRASLAAVAGLLSVFGGWVAASSMAGPQRRLAPVTGADYVISIAVARHPLGEQMKLTLTYSLAKVDDAVAHQGRLESIAVKNGEALRPLFMRTADELTDIVLTGRPPASRQSSDEAVLR